MFIEYVLWCVKYHKVCEFTYNLSNQIYFPIANIFFSDLLVKMSKFEILIVIFLWKGFFSITIHYLKF